MGRSWAGGSRAVDTLQLLQPTIKHKLPVLSLQCLAEVMYFEARSEGKIGQLAVADVVMARVLSSKYPNNICDVIHEKGQFTYNKQVITEDKAWVLALRLAKIVLLHRYVAVVPGATHYHAIYVHPKWSTGLTVIKTIKKHIFYKI